MLRVHILQVVYNLSDPSKEETLFDILAARRFAGVQLGRVSDETTILRFRQLLKPRHLGEALLAAINRHLTAQGFRLQKQSETIVDASILAAPVSTKKADGQARPQLHSTCKGRYRHFGLKLHVDVGGSCALFPHDCRP